MKVAAATERTIERATMATMATVSAPTETMVGRWRKTEAQQTLAVEVIALTE